FVHVDLYRLEPEEVEELGLEERLAGDGVKVVEWADRLPFRVAGARVMEILRSGPDNDTARVLVERTAGAERRGDDR
ncbi:MAG: tRNA (adenosine(37)-N6)-threonylcarbamoyltransferase complex ATPase subunit type 1 TsaE, partial [Thermoanaerobaculia bacterium]|nr:tRNA (adenosine(37)-N6)-threonylcarbamoyltransferase complex ATPase subunit type 1 TsaE [Thermoanaerobaculia bacterium]